MTSSVAGSRASLPATQESAWEPQTCAGSGQRCFERWLRLGPVSLWQRTCTASLLTTAALSSRLCTLTWTQRVTKRSRRLYFRLLPSVPHIDGIASGFLPTPDTTTGAPNKGSNKRNGPKSLIEAARLWPTPMVADADGGRTSKGAKRPNEGGLSSAVKLWSTPTVRDAESLAKASRGAGSLAKGNQLVEPLVVQVGGTLNPEWVEWLMGFPAGWTDLGDSETPSSHK